MRKLIVVLMAVLMLVSFTSCNQDKIDELEKKVKDQEAEIAQKEAEKETFSEFAEAFKSVMAVEVAYEQVIFDKKVKGSPITVYYKSDDDYIVPKFSGDDYDWWLSQQVLLRNPNIKDAEYSEKASGTVTYEGTLKKNDFAYKIVNNIVEVKYKLEDSGEWNEETIKVDIDGSISCKKDSDDATTAKVTFAFKGTIYGESIDLSFVATMSPEYRDYIKFSAATINGKNVDLVLLNNLASGLVPMSTLYKSFGV